MYADRECYFPIYRRKKRSQNLLLILFALLIMQAKPSANLLKLSNLRCKSLSEYLNITQCKFKPLRRGFVEATVEIIVLRKPIYNATVRSVIRKRGVDTGKPLLDIRIDCCAFQRNKRRNFMANLLYQFMGLERWSNMNHTCPYDHDLLLKNYPLDSRTMGKFLPFPLGHYTLTTFWASYSDVDCIVEIHFQLFEK